MNALEEQISRLKTVVEDCYIAVSENNGEVPEELTLINLPTAIKTTTSGGSSEALEELFGLPDSMPSVEVMTDNEVYTELETIIPTMDAEISSQQASEFSNTVRSIVSSETETIGEREGGSVIEQFFGVAGYEFISEETILQEMETIMQGLDNDLTAEMATNITAETQTIIH